MNPPNFTYDTKRGQYRRAGKFVKATVVQKAVDGYLQRVGEKSADALFDQLREGRLSVKDAQLLGEKMIARSHLNAAIAAKGGRAQMSQADFGRVGNLVKPELKFWRDRMQTLAKGAPIDGPVKASFRAYVANAANTFFQIEGDELEKRGFDLEKYVLNDNRHCEARAGYPSCREVAARGYQKRGTLPRRGGCACRHSCRCGRRYKNSATGEVRG